MPYRSLIGKLIVVLCLGAVLGGPAEAQVDLNGDWDFTVELPALGCTWAGAAQFMQTGATLAGSGNLPLTVTGACGAIPFLAGNVSGAVSGQMVAFTFTGPGGVVSFDGSADMSVQTLTGTWSIPGTNFAGTWSATRQMVAPTLPEWGLIGMLSALLASGIYCLRRQRSSLP